MKSACVAFSIFLIIAGSWFALMEILLRHRGSILHAAGAALIVVYSALSLACIRCNPNRVLRVIVLLGAVCVIPLGIAAGITTLRSIDFEGYILLIGLGLAMQGLLMIAFSLSRLRPRHA